jgi:hypothetical protein
MRQLGQQTEKWSLRSGGVRDIKRTTSGSRFGPIMTLFVVEHIPEQTPRFPSQALICRRRTIVAIGGGRGVLGLACID